MECFENVDTEKFDKFIKAYLKIHIFLICKIFSEYDFSKYLNFVSKAKNDFQ